MKFHVLSLFPGILKNALAESILGKALSKKTIEVNLVDIRDFSTDRHRAVDDYPYGGGPGMVIKPEPIFRAAESIGAAAGTPVILLTPQGERFSQRMAAELSGLEELVLICGKYEGVDERVRQFLVTREISIGDYILSGGEFPALVIIDSVSRLIPGVLGKDQSPADESFTDGLLEYPQYTRPDGYRGMTVPEVLLSGDHARIAAWRRERALENTLLKRPDLLEGADLDKEDKQRLDEIASRSGKTPRG